MDVPHAFVEAYKAAREFQGEELPDDVYDECDTICNSLLRVLREIDLQKYVDLVAWDASRMRLSAATGSD